MNLCGCCLALLLCIHGMATIPFTNVYNDHHTQTPIRLTQIFDVFAIQHKQQQQQCTSAAQINSNRSLLRIRTIGYQYLQMYATEIDDVSTWRYRLYTSHAVSKTSYLLANQKRIEFVDIMTCPSQTNGRSAIERSVLCILYVLRKCLWLCLYTWGT